MFNNNVFLGLNLNLILIFVILLYISSIGADNSCPYNVYREAKTQLDEFFFPVVDSYDYELPESCIFHKNNDLLLPFHDNIIEKRHNKYKCGYCNKKFSSREVIENHLIDNHSENLSDEPKTCLADYCDILQCQYYKESFDNYRVSSICDKQNLERRQFECNSLMNKCFPINEAADLNDLFTRAYCNPIRCLEHGELLEYQIHQKRSEYAKWPVTSILKVVGISSLIIIFGFLYLAYYLWQNETKTRYDLRRKSTGAVSKFFNSLRRINDKSKRY